MHAYALLCRVHGSPAARGVPRPAAVALVCRAMLPPLSGRAAYAGASGDVTATELARQNLGMCQDIADICTTGHCGNGGSGSAADSSINPLARPHLEAPPPVITSHTFGEDLALKYLNRGQQQHDSIPQDVVLSNPNVSACI